MPKPGAEVPTASVETGPETQIRPEKTSSDDFTDIVEDRKHHSQKRSHGVRHPHEHSHSHTHHGTRHGKYGVGLEFVSGDVITEGLTLESRVFSAPGKVILSGEHAVVYGKVAVASAINLRTWCTVTPVDAKAEEATEDGSPVEDTQLKLKGPATIKFSLPVADTRLNSRVWPTTLIRTVYEEYLRIVNNKKNDDSDKIGFLSQDEEVQFFIDKLVPLYSTEDVLKMKGGEKKNVDTKVATEQSAEKVKTLLKVAQKLALPYIIFHFILFRVLTKILNLSNLESSKFDYDILEKINKSLSFSVHTELPIQAGLGSSASFCVVLTKSLFETIGIEIFKGINKNVQEEQQLHYTLKDINDIAFEAEMVIHGKCSGVDNTLCCYGGSLKYQRGEMEPLTIPEVDVMIINTGIVRSTKEVVADVRKLKAQYEPVIEPLMESIGNIGVSYYEIAKDFAMYLEEFEEATKINSDSVLAKQEVLESIQTKFTTTLSDLFPLNQTLLKGLGVSNVEVDLKLDKLSDLGVCGKIAGAGRGGCLVGVFNERTGSDSFTKLRRKNSGVIDGKPLSLLADTSLVNVNSVSSFSSLSSEMSSANLRSPVGKNATNSPISALSRLRTGGILSPVEGFMPTFVIDSPRPVSASVYKATNGTSTQSSTASLQRIYHQSRTRLDERNLPPLAPSTNTLNSERGDESTPSMVTSLQDQNLKVKFNILGASDTNSATTSNCGSGTDDDDDHDFPLHPATEVAVDRTEKVHSETAFLAGFSRAHNRIQELIEIRNELCDQKVFNDNDIWIATLGCEGVREDALDTLLGIAPERFRYGQMA